MSVDAIAEEVYDKDGLGDIGENVRKSVTTPTFITLVKLLLGVLLVAAVVMFSTSMMKYGELKAEQKRLEDELCDLETEIEELKFLLDSPVDYDYIVRVAREKLNMFLPDEIVYYSDIND